MMENYTLIRHTLASNVTDSFSVSVKAVDSWISQTVLVRKEKHITPIVSDGKIRLTHVLPLDLTL